MASAIDGGDEQVYDIVEHKKEVRLGLRHRNSFAVMQHQKKGQAVDDSDSMAAILAALAEPGEKGSSGEDAFDEDDEVLEEGGPDAGDRGAAGAEDKVDRVLNAMIKAQEARKRNVFMSMLKGMGARLGLRKSKKQRQAEETAAATKSGGCE